MNPECSLAGLMLNLQYFGHLIQRVHLLEKTLMLGKIESKRRGQQRMRRLDIITDSMDMRTCMLSNFIWSKLRESEGQESLVCCSPLGRRESDMT